MGRDEIITVGLPFGEARNRFAAALYLGSHFPAAVTMVRRSRHAQEIRDLRGPLEKDDTFADSLQDSHHRAQSGT